MTPRIQVRIVKVNNIAYPVLYDPWNTGEGCKLVRGDRGLRIGQGTQQCRFSNRREA